MICHLMGEIKIAIHNLIDGRLGNGLDVVESTWQFIDVREATRLNLAEFCVGGDLLVLHVDQNWLPATIANDCAV